MEKEKLKRFKKLVEKYITSDKFAPETADYGEMQDMAEMFLECGAEETAKYPVYASAIQRQLPPGDHVAR